MFLREMKPERTAHNPASIRHRTTAAVRRSTVARSLGRLDAQNNRKVHPSISEAATFIAYR
jgi:hypothetical protein